MIRGAEGAGPELTMAERKRLLVRDELTEAALRLLAAQGFEATTIDQIVAEAGVSRRTFFRYFRSKEDVIIESVGDVGEFLCEALAARPDGERAADAIRAVLGLAVSSFTEHPEKSLGLVRLVVASPALKGRFLERQSESARAMAAVLARRSGRPANDLRAQVTASVAMTVFDTALMVWAAQEGRPPLQAVLDEAFSVAANALA